MLDCVEVLARTGAQLGPATVGAVAVVGALGGVLVVLRRRPAAGALFLIAVATAVAATTPAVAGQPGVTSVPTTTGAGPEARSTSVTGSEACATSVPATSGQSAESAESADSAGSAGSAGSAESAESTGPPPTTSTDGTRTTPPPAASSTSEPDDAPAATASAVPPPTTTSSTPDPHASPPPTTAVAVDAAGSGTTPAPEPPTSIVVPTTVAATGAPEPPAPPAPPPTGAPTTATPPPTTVATTAERVAPAVPGTISGTYTYGGRTFVGGDPPGTYGSQPALPAEQPLGGGYAGAGVRLSGTATDGTPISRSTTTGAGGAFQFGEVPPGRYTITASLPDVAGVSGTWSWPGCAATYTLGGWSWVAPAGGAINLELQAAERRSGQDFNAQNTSSVDRQCPTTALAGAPEG